MKLRRISLHDFRNFAQAEVEPCDGINFVAGSNGSGKTSLIESIYLLGRGRSFRSARLGQAIREGAREFVVHGRFRSGHGVDHQIGVRKRRGVKGIEARLDGKEIEGRERLITLFPLLLINNESYRLVEGGPKYRRQFVDWGMFHVERVSRETWQEYRRTLKQRNAALRQAPGQARFWTERLATIGYELDQARRRFIEVLNPEISKYCMEFLGGPGSFEYRVGWSSAEELLDLLTSDLAKDRDAGYTRNGPHSANVAFEVGGWSSRERLSRGQEKLGVFALMLAQLTLFRRLDDLASVLLIDDLGAELDADNQALLLETLGGLGTQLFITGTAIPPSVEGASGELKVFHVKRGTLSSP